MLVSFWANPDPGFPGGFTGPPICLFLLWKNSFGQLRAALDDSLPFVAVGSKRIMPALVELKVISQAPRPDVPAAPVIEIVEPGQGLARRKRRLIAGTEFRVHQGNRELAVLPVDFLEQVVVAIEAVQNPEFVDGRVVVEFAARKALCPEREYDDRHRARRDVVAGAHME